jgi:hypothetical protein
MNTMEKLRATLIDAINTAPLTNRQFAKGAGISEALACRIRKGDETPKLETIEKCLRALGKRVEIRILPLMIALALIPAPALAQLPYNPPQCAVTAHIVINTYIGPIDITDVCMTTTTYTGGLLEFIGIDLADGIFRDGFDGVMP